MKRITVVLLIAIMLLSTCINAFAADTELTADNIQNEIIKNAYLMNRSFVVVINKAVNTNNLKNKIEETIENNYVLNVKPEVSIKQLTNRKYLINFIYPDTTEPQADILFFTENNDERDIASEIGTQLNASSINIALMDDDNSFSLIETEELPDTVGISVDTWSYKYEFDNFFVNINIDYEYITESSKKEFVKKQISEISKKIFSKTETTAEKVAAVNKYIVSNYYYQNTDDLIDHSAYGLLKNGYGVCQGYAELGMLLLKSGGVPVRYISNDTHGWLIIRYEDGKWYHFDPTWNDPITDFPSNDVLTSYNKVTSGRLQKERSWDTDFYSDVQNDYCYENYDLRKITFKNNYDYITWNGIEMQCRNDMHQSPIIGMGVAVVPLEYAKTYLSTYISEEDNILKLYRGKKLIEINTANGNINAEGNKYGSLINYNGIKYISLRVFADIFGDELQVAGDEAVIVIKNAY